MIPIQQKNFNGHIAPGSSDCLETWSRNYYLIIERYADTITGMFYGHSHADEFEMFYEAKDYRKPTNVAYLGPSVTTYENFNPAYRIYYVDGDHENTTREVFDHETWTMDLNKANEDNSEPVWYKLYSAKDAYQMKSLRAEQWDSLLQRMTKDSNLFDMFYKNYYRNSAATPYCDKQCKIQILCDLKSGKSHSRRQLCSDLEVT
nr:unnamed protein product [Callosobruchus analis]